MSSEVAVDPVRQVMTVEEAAVGAAGVAAGGVARAMAVGIERVRRPTESGCAAVTMDAAMDSNADQGGAGAREDRPCEAR